jgi:hypothetical protein
MRPIVAIIHTLRQSAHGWRLTYYDTSGEPVASFWSTTQQGTFALARPHVASA